MGEQERGQQLSRLQLGMMSNCQWLKVTGDGVHTHDVKLDCAKAAHCIHLLG